MAQTSLLRLALSVLLAGCLALGACKKTPINGNDMPPHFVFALLDKQGNELLTSMSTPIAVWFVQNGQRKDIGSECMPGECTMIREAHSSTGSQLKYKFYYQSLDMPLVSSNGYKTFFIQQGSKTDTLSLDVQKTNPNDPLDKYDIASVSFNGKPVLIDEDQLPVWPLRRH